MLGVTDGVGLLCLAERCAEEDVVSLVPRRFVLGVFAGTYRSADVGCRTRFISCLPSADQRSTVTRKNDTSMSLRNVKQHSGSTRWHLLNVHIAPILSLHGHFRYRCWGEGSPILQTALSSAITFGRAA